MTEREIQNRFCSHKKLGVVVPNCGALYGEADLLRVTAALLVHVYEIKVSRSDFCRDKHKQRAARLQSAFEKGTENAPNFFWYLTPPMLVSRVDVPEYAGLIYVDGPKFFVIKKAPQLHRKKIELDRLLYVCRGMSFRYWQQRRGADVAC